MCTLVAVDMQPAFNAANGKRVRENFLKEIMWAIKNNAPLSFLSMMGMTAPCRS